MNFSRANKGLSTPVTLSFLLFSFTILTVATYSFAMSSVKNKTGRLNYAAAKQDMLTLENSMSGVLWSPGSSVIQSFRGYGGQFETKPNLRRLIINLKYGSSSYLIFNETIGYVRYEMPPTDLGEAGWFLTGDDRTIINQSYAGISQMYIRTGEDSQEIYFGYRPLAISYLDTSQNNVVNVVRIFLVNLNSSESLLFQGSFRVRVRCVNVTTKTQSYNFTYGSSFIVVRASVEGDEGAVYLPVFNDGGFVLVRMEILVCDVRLEEVRA